MSSVQWGETTLQLLQWVTEAEAKQKETPVVRSTPPGQVTQSAKSTQMKKSNRIKGDRLTARSPKQANRPRGSASPSKNAKPVAITVFTSRANAELLRRLGYLGGISIEALASGIVAAVTPGLELGQHGYRDDDEHMGRLEDGREVIEEIPELARFTPPGKPAPAKRKGDA